MLFYNGNIHTMDAALPRATVLAVRDGRIVYVGDDREAARRLLPAETEAMDLEGRTVIPGLADTHQHFIMQGQHLAELDIHMKSKEAILGDVAAKVKTLRPGEWVLGRGWSHEVWPGREWPRKEDLDRVAPLNPVALTRLDGHSLWVNSCALREGGLDRNSPEYPGGEILRSADGDLLGVLIDTPAFKVRSAVPPQTEEQKRAACLRAQEDMFRHGITSVGDAWQTAGDHELLKGLYTEGALKIRIYGMLSSWGEERRSAPKTDRLPVRGLFGDKLSLGAYKIVLDGSLGSRSAWLTEGYADRPGHAGNHRYTDDELYAVAAPACANGFQICIHAIGDAAVFQALGLLERLHREHGASGGQGKQGTHAEGGGRWLPHRIEHFQTAGPDVVARALRLGVIPAMQTIHAFADKAMAEARLSPALLGRSYPWREILDCGGIIANGSDSPMDGVNPFHGMHAAVTRTPFSCQNLPAESVRMTREEALLSYTLWAARAELAEAEKGSLTVGKHADCLVLDRDIMVCPEDGIRDARVLLTMVGGETVYETW